MKRYLGVSRRGKPRIALVYDWVDKWGGAEQLLLSLHKVFPEAPLFTSIYNPEKARWAENFKVLVSWLGRLPGVTKHEWVFPLIPIAFESFDFNQFDVVISVSSAFSKGIITAPPTAHVGYCLSPTRFLWGERELYERKLPRLLRGPSTLIREYLCIWDKIAAWRPDYLIGISNYVASEVRRDYGREVDEVIYPPLPPMTRLKVRRGKKGYFLVVSRLVPYKRVELVIEAFSKLDNQLRVAGSGSEEDRLRRMAGSNVEFMGEVSEEEKRDLYDGAIAVIVPQKEDFGLVALEAGACGVPVVAYAGGGNLEVVKNKVSGVFFAEQTAESLVFVIKRTNFGDFSARACREQAERFSFEKFKRQWNLALDRLGGVVY